LGVAEPRYVLQSPGLVENCVRLYVPLLEFNQYDNAFADFVHKAIHELMRSKDPLLSSVRVDYSEQILIVQNTMPSGEVVESRPIKISMSFGSQFDEVVAGRFSNLLQAINDAAEQGLKTLMPQIFEQLGRVSVAAGTSMDAKGAPLTWKLLLQSFENMEIDFDKDGKVKIGIFVSPDVYEQFENLPPPTQQEQEAWNEMLRRKKAEFDARQRRRKLS
jgi:hypothetical protein